MRRRIVLLVAATTSIVLLAFTLPLIILINDLAQSSAVERATTIAQSLVPVVSNSGTDQIDLAITSLAKPEGTTVSVVLPTQKVLGNPRAIDQAIKDTVAGAGASTQDRADGGRTVLIPVYVNSGVRVIAVDISADALSEGLVRASVVIAALALALFVASLLMADRIARTMTRPLNELARTAEALATGNLDARVEPAGPDEVLNVGTAMNALAQRIGELLVAEREALADLSHRLRTPLTALRLDTEALAASSERDRIESDLDLMERSLDDVIRTAARPAQDKLVARCDVGKVLLERVQFWSVLAEDQGRQVHTDISSKSMRIGLDADDLAACVDAALGNIFAHTDEGVGFSVSAQPWINDTIHIAIEDQGKGLPSNANRLSQRGVSGSGSTGLGMDIMRRTAESTGGHFEVAESPTGGVRINLSFAMVKN